MRASLWLALLCLGILTACGDGQEAAGDSLTPADTADTASRPAGARSTTAVLEGAARRVVGFLRAEVTFDSLALADSIELRVAPEGGGAVRRVRREALRDPAAWLVGEGAQRVRLVPAADYTVVTTAVGRHYRCQEQELAAVAPEWAQRPHVGVRLQPDGAASCLQSWNATFLFDTAGGAPRLAGVLYDQWEW